MSDKVKTKASALGILAGEGEIPVQLIAHVLQNNIPIFVVQFEGCDYGAWPSIDAPILETRMERVGEIFQFFNDNNVDNVVMIGNLQRPDLAALRPDWVGAKTLCRIAGAMIGGGDDALLKTLKQEINRAGFNVVGVDHYLTCLTAETGVLTDVSSVQPYLDAVHEALRYGAQDKGQSILYHADGTYSYETRDGTAALIETHGRDGSVLIKMVKPQQDPDLDRPTVGLKTMQALQAKKCAGMVVQANGVFMINHDEMIKYANEHGLFIEAVHARSQNGRKNIYLIAGEESGDVLGGRLMYALNDKGDFNMAGVGGRSMREEGLCSLFPMEDLSVMGIFEILPRLKLLMKRINETVDDIILRQPDIVVTIDSPDFCKRVVKHARKKCPNTKFIHYVAPTVWAWRPGRAKTMANLFDGLICLFPFEPPYFEKEGLNAQYCGHPVVEKIKIDDDVVRQNDHILILPGSRKGEVKRMASVFAETFQKMRAMNPALQAHVVALPHVKDTLQLYFPKAVFIDPVDRYDAFKTAPFALATSGTVGLELAVAQCPHVIAYKVNALTAWVLRRLITVKYAHLVNIMEGREVIPECIQEDCDADDILAAVMNYKTPDLSKVREKLSGQDPSKSPAEQAAEFILGF